ELNAPQLKFARRKNAKVPIGNTHSGIDPGGTKANPAVAAFVSERKPGGLFYFFPEHLHLFSGGARFFKPQRIDNRVNKVISLTLGHFLGFEKHLAAVGIHAFMRLDAAEPGVAKSQITKTGHKSPLKGLAAPLENF